MIELRRDPETGEVVAYEDGRPVGSVITMGDVLEGGPSEALDDAGRALGRERQPAALRWAQESLERYSGKEADVAVDGVTVNQDNTEEVQKGIVRAIDRALEEIGLAAEGYAKRACPVDTGNLRNSITHAVESGEDAVYVGTSVEYAPYVELGTSRTAAQPFLRPAATEHGSTYRSILKRNLEEG